MARTDFGRPRHARIATRYSSDVTGAESALPPKDFPPAATVRYFSTLGATAAFWPGSTASRSPQPVSQRDTPRPTAGVNDSQSVKIFENTSLSGFDAGKRIKGRKRHIGTDTCGHPNAFQGPIAKIQDRGGAPGVFARLRLDAPDLRRVFAPLGRLLRNRLSGNGWRPCRAKAAGRGDRLRTPDQSIVKRSDAAAGFEVLPGRRVVKGAFARPGKCRRPARDRGKTNESAEAWGAIAYTRRITRHPAKACHRSTGFELDSEGLHCPPAQRTPRADGPIAQLDRVLDYESRGRGFESSPVRH